MVLHLIDEKNARPANSEFIEVVGASEHNLKGLNLKVRRHALTVVTGVSGSGKSSLAFDTILAESQRRFFYTLSHYSRQFLDLGTRPQVRSIKGLSPSIALAQNETAPSRRATLGSLTDLSELLAVMYARCGIKHCPTHGLKTHAMTRDEILSKIVDQVGAKTLVLLAPIAESKKGVFKAQLQSFAQKGYSKVWIDGKVLPLDPLPELQREEKHTIKVIVDVLKIKSSGPSDRLQRGLDAVLSLTGGFGEWLLTTSSGLDLSEIDMKSAHSFSTKGGCPQCGFAWPKLDSRYFNSNSLGRCEDCDGYGTLQAQDYTDAGDESDSNDLVAEPVCPACQGTGVQKEAEAITLGNYSIQSLLNLPTVQLIDVLRGLATNPSLASNPAFLRVYEEVRNGLLKLSEMKLGYLSLARRVRSLSGGEAQRVKLAGILSENLRGVLYVLDEPSQGLHHSELHTVIQSLYQLRDQGNTIIVVDHDETMMNAADEIIDLGPTGGAGGGYLMATFPPRLAPQFAEISKTAKWLSRTPGRHRPKAISEGVNRFLIVKEPKLHNLKMKEIKIPLEALTVITGVSGAGKSSAILGVLFPNLLGAMELPTGKPEGKSSGKNKKQLPWSHCREFDGWQSLKGVYLIDRRPVAKSSVSMAATYLDITSDIRDLYAQMPESQIAGLTARSFSLHLEGGRCPECKGRGEVNLTMKFLADARIKCPVCRGRRFRSHVLDVKFNNRNMAEVLELSIDEAIEHFKNHKRILYKLLPAQRMGLGYLKLGQPSASLSGGEAQRLKMVPFFTKKMGQDAVLILDEPTTGLHFEDVEKLLVILRQLVDEGATVIVVEHSDEVRRIADWQIEVGPGAAHEGGQIVHAGVPSFPKGP
jgi:excinuclease ABC subunit A